MGEEDAVHDVRVIVVSDGDESRLGKALAGILERAEGLDLDAVVVDRLGDSCADYVERDFVGVRAIRGAGRGLGQAFNRALEDADARYVLFADSRTEVCAGSLQTLVSALDSRPDVALAGVRQLREDGTPVASTGRFPSSLHTLADSLGLAGVPGARRVLGEYELDPGRYEQARPCKWTSGPMLVRTAALAQVGWFDERLFHLAAEMDLCRRLRRAGWEILYTPCLTARRHRVSHREAVLGEAQAAYGRMQFALKHFPYLAADYRWALAVSYALRLARRRLSWRSGDDGRRAARAALSTVLTGRVPLAEPSAL